MSRSVVLVLLLWALLPLPQAGSSDTDRIILIMSMLPNSSYAGDIQVAFNLRITNEQQEKCANDSVHISVRSMHFS